MFESLRRITGRQNVLCGTYFDRIVWLLYRDGGHKSIFGREPILAKVRFAGSSLVGTR